ncbi:acyl-CoA thioester hydrolase/BAAT C-terminal domain-containing protein [Streptosporangium carneum]|uniref:Acyl-CoA thioesterase n=1 Tax=Streptosporangium carneum TaxID=47481 RepID=A0A9W6MGF3_9ACTN|nr:acyl-CoA thioester hydrolase/BAAT C-terminal domain-containing protein [Streptosporangium carneum]GLK13181.1 acyl-CoA thioesterase [Streptosporangium carneum]
MEIIECGLAGPWEGIMVRPGGGGDVGVLVLAGSSGRVETERARLLARQGATALSIRWFGGPGQPEGICEIPLETFTAAIDLLVETGVRRVGVMGLSKGAEAALLVAGLDPRVEAVVALAPSSVAWANVGPGADGNVVPRRSSWTWRGEPVPFVPYDEDWSPAESEGVPKAYRTLYERSLERFAGQARAAAIPVERANADILLVAGADDQMWPSLSFAEELAERRSAAGRPVRVVSGPDAGHRLRFPGEPAVSMVRPFRYGGSPEADAALGAAAWPHVLETLRIGA